MSKIKNQTFEDHNQGWENVEVQNHEFEVQNLDHHFHLLEIKDRKFKIRKSKNKDVKNPEVQKGKLHEVQNQGSENFVRKWNFLRSKIEEGEIS